LHSESPTACPRLRLQLQLLRRDRFPSTLSFRHASAARQEESAVRRPMQDAVRHREGARVHSCREDSKMRRALSPEVCFSTDASIFSKRVGSRKKKGRKRRAESAIRNRISPSNIPSGSAPDSPRHRALRRGVRRSAGTHAPTCVAKDSKPAGTACAARR
jgi:hypothetical protein